jgi:two-component system NarL family sensor kinase
VLALSATDLAVITASIFITSAFRNTYFPMYYPALLVMSLVANSRRLSFGAVTLVASVYAAISLTMGDTVDFDIKEERILIIRIAAMYAVVAAGHLMTRIERERRHEAVDAERALAEKNLELQRVAQEAELAAQAERGRIAREIHDGIAQSIYALSLNLETCVVLAERVRGPLQEQLQRLVPLARKTLLETRHYIFDLKPLLSGERDLNAMAENQVKEFQIVAGVPARLSTEGQPYEVPLAVAAGLYRILQEALANVLKHARASEVRVALTYEAGQVRLSVQDDGAGFQMDDVRPGLGLENMRERARELHGSFELSGGPGEGTGISVTLPAQGGAA